MVLCVFIYMHEVDNNKIPSYFGTCDPNIHTHIAVSQFLSFLEIFHHCFETSIVL